LVLKYLHKPVRKDGLFALMVASQREANHADSATETIARSDKLLGSS
jgi:hypothetical protein